jgi:alpha-mannosidase
MLQFCQATGARGNVNFDVAGYEKLAIEDPESFDQLRSAVRKGVVEVVGASYGQPYGGLHFGESNIRQRVLGIRSALRLFGVRPRGFWEEEFDFFPQLPQILAGCGFENASLFFQWTWHTPEIPVETEPVVLWEGIDGSRLRAATRNRLNLHQWPEDIQILLDELAGKSDLVRAGREPLILQWLELMPSPDWMCRSEVLLPKTRELLSDPRFEFRMTTLSGYLDSQPEELEVRAYAPDEVFHGMTLGKNGDSFRRLSRAGEHQVLTAETLATLAGRFGRPYAQWDVYPTWELEEAWRELANAQHHDNDECEGLCGHVGKLQYERSRLLADGVVARTVDTLAQRIAAEKGQCIAFNPLGWPVSATVMHPGLNQEVVVRDIPSMGWKCFDSADIVRQPDVWHLSTDGAFGRRKGLEVTLDRKGRITQIVSPEWPDGLLDPATPLLDFWTFEQGERVAFTLESMEINSATGDLVIRFQHPGSGGLRVDLRLVTEVGALDITVAAGSLPRMDAGMNAGLRTRFATRSELESIVTDSAYAFHEVQGTGSYRKKYPTGDWMTSPQWFEEIRNPIHSLSATDLVSAHGGLLILHDGSPQWFRRENALENLLTCYDPWDGDYWINRIRVHYRLIPHGGLTHADRYRLSQSFLRPPVVVAAMGPDGDLPPVYSALRLTAPDACVTALYRETRDRGEHFETYAPARFEADYPTFLRMVDFGGKPGTAELWLDGEVAAMVRTNMLGEASEGSEVELRDGRTTVPMRRHEIATFAFDWVPARKRPRDLDAHRQVWATVHRQD